MHVHKKCLEIGPFYKEFILGAAKKCMSTRNTEDPTRSGEFRQGSDFQNQDSHTVFFFSSVSLAGFGQVYWQPPEIHLTCLDDFLEQSVTCNVLNEFLLACEVKIGVAICIGVLVLGAAAGITYYFQSIFFGFSVASWQPSDTWDWEQDSVTILCACLVFRFKQ